jgi:hypothetical protein
VNKNSAKGLIPEARLLFALLVAALGSTKAKSVWADIAKAKRGTGKLASQQYNAVLSGMWEKHLSCAGITQGALIRKAVQAMDAEWGERATGSRTRHLERKWPAYRRMREAEQKRHAQMLAQAAVRPCTPLAGALFDLLPPPTEKPEN